MTFPQLRHNEPPGISGCRRICDRMVLTDICRVQAISGALLPSSRMLFITSLSCSLIQDPFLMMLFYVG